MNKLDPKIQKFIQQQITADKMNLAKMAVTNAKTEDVSLVVKYKFGLINKIEQVFFKRTLNLNSKLDRDALAAMLVFVDEMFVILLKTPVMSLIQNTKIPVLIADLNVKILTPIVKRSIKLGSEAEALNLSKSIIAAVTGFDNKFDIAPYTTKRGATPPTTNNFDQHKTEIGASIFSYGLLSAFAEESSKAVANHYNILGDYVAAASTFRIIDDTITAIRKRKSIVNVAVINTINILANSAFALAHKFGLGFLAYILHAFWNMIVGVWKGLSIIGAQTMVSILKGR